MNKNLDLTKILKDCPKGTELYSPIVGTVYLFSVNDIFIRTIKSKEDCNSQTFVFYPNGKIFDNPNAECLLFPSKDNRDWSTFKVPNKLPKTWEEFCENNRIKDNECFITGDSHIKKIYGDRSKNVDRNLLPNEEYAKAMLALCQLIQLRDCYNEGWQPNWRDKNYKYCIQADHYDITFENWYSFQAVLAFKTDELRDEFYNNFKDLIEIAKPLL